MKRFNAQEALEYGLIDRIVRPPRIKADAPKKESTGLGQLIHCLSQTNEKVVDYLYQRRYS